MSKTDRKRVYVSEYYLQLLRQLSPALSPLNDTDLVNHVLASKVDLLLASNPQVQVQVPIKSIETIENNTVSLEDELD